MSQSVSQLLALIPQKVISGNRSTTASGVRELLSETVQAYLNLNDGGLLVNALAGYATVLTPTDPKHFATKKYVDDLNFFVSGTAGQVPQYQAGAWVKTTSIQDKYGNTAIDLAQSLPWYSFHGLQVQDGYGIDVVTTGTLNLGVNNASAVVIDVQPDSDGNILIGGNAALTYIGFTDSNVIALADGTIAIKAGGSSDPTSILIFPATTTIGNELLVSADATNPLGVVTLQQFNNGITSIYRDKGNYDASVNVFPSTGGSGTSGAILKGDIWTISVVGALGGTAVKFGDTVRALTDVPGQTSTNWQISEHGLGYTPITNVLNSTQILVGNSSNVATPVTMSGDITINNTGVTAIGASKVTNAMLAGSIADTKLVGSYIYADGTRGLSGNWAAGNFYISAAQIGIGTGTTAPVSALQIIETSTSTTRGIASDQYSTNASGARITMRKARGTFASPTVIVTADTLASWTASGYDGTNFIESGKILITSTGTVGTGIVPSTMALQTMNAAGTLTTGILIDQAQKVTFAGHLVVEGVTSTGATGTGNFVFDTAPTFTTSITTPMAIVPSTGTGFYLYNTTDQVTNYERLQIYKSANIFRIEVQNGGTGSARVLALVGGAGRTITIGNTAITGLYQFGAGTSGTGLSALGVNGAWSNSSGINNGYSFLQTINQSGSAGYRGVWVSPFEQAVGSGPKLLFDVGTNTLADGAGAHTSKASIDNAGNLVIAGTLNTLTLPTSGALAKSCDVQVFTSNGTWTMPTGAKSVTVLCIGPGAGGGSGRVSASGTLATGGGGGAGGGTSQMTFRATDLPSSVSISTGTGGSGGAAQSSSSSDGNAGSQATTGTGFGGFVVGGRGGAGQPGTSTTGASGGTGASGMFNSVTGGSSSATGGLGNSGNNGVGLCGGSGGAGGGITTATAVSGGGNGGVPNITGGASVPAGGSSGGGAGANGAVTTNPYAATGGAGGGSSITGNGGKGGDAGSYGAGGGGGGAALNGFSSGAGGKGGDGICVVITYF